MRNYGQLLAERKLFTSLGGPAENNLGRNTKSKNQLRQFGSADNVEGRKNLTSLGDWEIFRHEKVVQLWFESSKSWYVPTFLALEPVQNSTPLTTASERASVRVRNYGQLLAE